MSTTDQFDAASAEAAASSQTTALGAIAAYSPTEAALALLAEKYKDATYDLTTVKGDKAARAARKELTGLRTSLEAKRKQLKAPALEYSRRIDSEAARITNAIAALEDPISDQIKADEQRREDERQERARAEATRIEAHQKAIETLRRVPPEAYHADTTPEQIDTMMAALLLIPIGPDLEEFEQQAEAAVSATLATLRELRAAALGRQLEIRRVQTERAELDRRRAEDAAREQAKREQDAHYLAAEQARVRAEAEAERQRLEQQRLEQAERQRQLDAQAATLAEQQRQADKAKEFARLAEVMRVEAVNEQLRLVYEATKQAAARATTVDASRERALRLDTRQFDPESNNGRLMIAVCAELGSDAPKLLAACKHAGSLLLAVSDITRTVDIEGERYDLLEASLELARAIDASAADTLILETALRLADQSLDDFVGACLDSAGALQAPSKAALMAARSKLPPHCKHTLSKTRTQP